MRLPRGSADPVDFGELFVQKLLAELPVAITWQHSACPRKGVQLTLAAGTGWQLPEAGPRWRRCLQ